MSFFDKVKGVLARNKKTAKDAVNKASTFVQSKTSDSVDPKVAAAAKKAEDTIDKIAD